MLKDRSELETNLREAIERVKYNRKHIEQINQILRKNDILPGTFSEVTKTESLISEIDLKILFLVTNAVFQIDGSHEINPNIYFTEREIEECKKYRHENREHNVKLPIEIEDVIQIDYENYLSKIKMSELVEWYNAKLIVYDFETQRSPKYKLSKDGVIPVPDVNIESVKDISEHMLNETYIPDTMTINIYCDSGEAVIYNQKTRKLTVSEDSIISILDGFHRLQGGLRAMSQNPELNLYIGIEIKIFDTNTAKKYFGQKNTINVVNKARIDELKQEKLAYTSVKQLQMNSDMKGRIASSSKVSSIAGHLTTADILANAIEDIFEPKNSFEAREIGNYLCNYFDYLLGMFSDKFANNSNESLMSHPIMFVGYIVISKYFRNNETPLNKIKDVISALDISKNNVKLTDIIANHRGSILQRRIREYFENIDLNAILK